MSGAKAKIVSEINLEEFERRLRAASAPQAGVEDPLAELTRLVDTIVTERPANEKVVELSSARPPKTERVAPAKAPEPPAAVAPPPPAARSAAPEPAAAQPVPPPLDFDGFDEEPEAPELRAAIDEMASIESEAGALEGSEPPPAAMARPARRAGSWYVKIGALGALAVVMAGGAVALKFGMPGRPKTPPMILADTAPTKVAPPTESAVQSAGDTGALLLKDSATPTTVKIINHEEQPVDLGARVANAPVTPSPSATPNAAGSPVAPTADTPVVAMTEPSGPTLSPTFAAGAKPVKTVSVRPDGSLISADVAHTAAAPAPAPSPAPAPASPKRPETAPLAATPTVELPAKPAVKSSARVNVAKTDTTVPADTAGGPMQLGPSGRSEKIAKLPTKLRPPAADAPAAAAPAPATQTADAAPAAAAPASSGEWSVQVAAPRSESEARSAIARIKAKYGDALGGAELGVHKAEVHGETLYRVRAGGMSKADAAAMCAKLKEAGGDCFLAKN